MFARRSRGPSNASSWKQLLRDASDDRVRVCDDDFQFVPVGGDGEEGLRCDPKRINLDRVRSRAIGIYCVGSRFGYWRATAVTVHDERPCKTSASIEKKRPDVGERAGLVGRGCNYARARLRVATPQSGVRASLIVGLGAGRDSQRECQGCGDGEHLTGGSAIAILHDESPFLLYRFRRP